MADYTYRISASGVATGADAGFTSLFNAIADFRTNNRMGAGVGVVPASSTLFFKFDGLVGSADAELFDINLSAAGSKVVFDAWSNPWNASTATALGDTTAYDGVAVGDASLGIFSAQGGNIEVRNIVVRKTAGTGALYKALQFSGTGTILLNGCLFVSTVAAGPLGVSLGGGTTMRNCLVFLTSAAQSGTVFALSCGEGTPTVEQSTFISNGGIGTLINSGGTTPVVKNSYVGGLSSTPWSAGGWGGTSVGNASSGTGTPNSGLNSVALSTTNFEGVTGAGDFRVKSGSVLKTTGAARLAGVLTDAYGTSRPDPATIGAAEAASAPAAVLSGGATLDGPAAGGGMSSLAPSTLSGDATLDGLAAGGGLGAAPGVLTSSWLQLNNTFAHTSAPFEAFVSNKTTGVLIVRKTGLTSSAHPTLPTCTFSDAALPAPGTQVRVTWRRTDTGAEGTELLIVA